MKILQVELLTADLRLTEHFYSNKLRLKLFRKNETSLSYVAGSSLLTFKFTQSLQPGYHIAFEIPGDQLKEAIKWMKDRIALISFEDNSVIVDFENWNAESIYFYDDTFNILEFIVRHDNNITGSREFDEASIVNISEVGLVNENVLQFAETLTRTYGIGHYEKQPPRDNFCAMGNASGLFVISGNGRNWFPTSIKAVKFPVYVRFEANGHEFELNYS